MFFFVSQVLDLSETFQEEECGPGNGDHGNEVFIPAEGILNNSMSNNHPEEIIAELSEPVCECSDTTQGEALLMILTFGLRHSFSYAAIVDTISFMNNLHQWEVIPATLYYLFKYVEPDTSSDMYHIVCPKCGVYLTGLSKANLNVQVTCACGTVIEKARETEGIAEALKYRFLERRLMRMG